MSLRGERSKINEKKMSQNSCKKILQLRSTHKQSMQAANLNKIKAPPRDCFVSVSVARLHLLHKIRTPNQAANNGAAAQKSTYSDGDLLFQSCYLCLSLRKETTESSRWLQQCHYPNYCNRHFYLILGSQRLEKILMWSTRLVPGLSCARKEVGKGNKKKKGWVSWRCLKLTQAQCKRQASESTLQLTKNTRRGPH